MRRFYQTVHRVRELNEISLQLLERDIFPDREQQGVIYNQYFLTRGSLIDIIDPNILIKRPQTILELFEVLTTQVEITGIYVECIRLLRTPVAASITTLMKNQSVAKFLSALSKTHAL